MEGINIDPYGSERTLTITPSANAHGEAVITISISDGSDQDSTAFTLTVNEKNDPTILSVARGGNGQLTVEWVGGGVLQSSTALKSWQAIEGAVSPFLADPVEASKYFRVILEWCPWPGSWPTPRRRPSLRRCRPGSGRRGRCRFG